MRRKIASYEPCSGAARCVILIAPTMTTMTTTTTPFRLTCRDCTAAGLCAWDADTRAQQGEALIAACLSGHVACTTELIRAGANVNARRRWGCDGDASVGAPWHRRCDRGMTAVMCACKSRSVGCVRALVNAGANVNLCDAFGHGVFTALCVRRDDGDGDDDDDDANTWTEITRLLVKGGALLSQRQPWLTPLCLAVAESRIHVARALLHAGAPIKPVKHAGCILMALACSAKEEVLRLLLDHGMDVDARERSGVTLLMVACMVGIPEFVSLLLQRGADAEARPDDADMTPLMFAAAANDVACSIPNVSGGGDDAFLHHAKLYRTSVDSHVACVRLLLEHGVAVDATGLQQDTHHHDDSRYSALVLACNADVTRALLDAGAFAYTGLALRIALQKRDFEQASVLVERCNVCKDDTSIVPRVGPYLQRDLQQVELYTKVLREMITRGCASDHHLPFITTPGIVWGCLLPPPPPPPTHDARPSTPRQQQVFYIAPTRDAYQPVATTTLTYYSLCLVLTRGAVANTVFDSRAAVLAIVDRALPRVLRYKALTVPARERLLVLAARIRFTRALGEDLECWRRRRVLAILRAALAETCSVQVSSQHPPPSPPCYSPPRVS